MQMFSEYSGKQVAFSPASKAGLIKPPFFLAGLLFVSQRKTAYCSKRCHLSAPAYLLLFFFSFKPQLFLAHTGLCPSAESIPLLIPGHITSCYLLALTTAAGQQGWQGKAFCDCAEAEHPTPTPVHSVNPPLQHSCPTSLPLQMSAFTWFSCDFLCIPLDMASKSFLRFAYQWFISITSIKHKNEHAEVYCVVTGVCSFVWT